MTDHESQLLKEVQHGCRIYNMLQIANIHMDHMKPFHAEVEDGLARLIRERDHFKLENEMLSKKYLAGMIDSSFDTK